MIDITSALATGVDVPAPECQLIIHQPTIKEISYVGDMDFFIGVQTLCLHKAMFVEDKDVLDDINNFQIFMTVVNEKEMVDKKKNVKKVLNLLFPTYNVIITPQSLIFQNGTETSTIDADNFEEFQNYLRAIFCTRDGPMDQTAFNPANDKAREIAQKLMRGRQRVAEQKGGNSQTNIFGRYLSILTIGLNSMTLQDLIGCTMYQLYDLMERYILYMNWDLDVRTRLAGGKPDSHPDDWMKDIH